MDLDAELDSYFLKDKDVGAKHLDSELDNYFKQRDASKKVGVGVVCVCVMCLLLFEGNYFKQRDASKKVGVCFFSLSTRNHPSTHTFTSQGRLLASDAHAH